MDTMECDETPDVCECVFCSGRGEFIGFLGSKPWFRCRNCGMDFEPEFNPYAESATAIL